MISSSFLRKAFLCCISLFSTLASFAQQPTEEELKLYNLIMEYRQEHNLPAIPLSKSLTIVAQTHVKDLQENRPVHGECNMHSWSDKGPWTPCCYTPDHAQSQAMWNKPRELTAYTGTGYEIAQGAYSTSLSVEGKAESALKGWQSSRGHNEVILNQGMWERHTWRAIGIGIYAGYAVVWFGEQTDPE